MNKMNPNENKWGVWTIAYKHVAMLPNFFELQNSIVEEQLKTSDYAEARAEINRIMQLK